MNKTVYTNEHKSEAFKSKLWGIYRCFRRTEKIKMNESVNFKTIKSPLSKVLKQGRKGAEHRNYYYLSSRRIIVRVMAKPMTTGRRHFGGDF